jgi:hypothetical protein
MKYGGCNRRFPIDNEKRRQMERQAAMVSPPAHPPALPGYPPLLRNYDHFMRPLNDLKIDNFMVNLGSESICFHTAGNSIPDSEVQARSLPPCPPPSTRSCSLKASCAFVGLLSACRRARGASRLWGGGRGRESRRRRALRRVRS